MVRAAWVVTLLAGCDLVYQLDRTPSAEPFLANPDGDADDDGTPNGDDLCPLIHDIDDVSATLDEDEDGVGNACDPRPGVPDCLALFDDFSGPLAPEWKAIGRAPVHDSGRLLLEADPEIVLYLDRPLDIMSLGIGGYIPISGSDTRSVQLFLDHEFTNGITGVGCSVQQDTPDDPTRVAHIEYRDGTAIAGGDSMIVGTHRLSAGYSIALAWNHASERDQCFVSLYDQGQPQQQSVLVPAKAGRNIAIRTTNTGLHLGAIVGFARICD